MEFPPLKIFQCLKGQLDNYLVVLMVGSYSLFQAVGKIMVLSVRLDWLHSACQIVSVDDEQRGGDVFISDVPLAWFFIFSPGSSRSIIREFTIISRNSISWDENLKWTFYC